MEHRKGIRLVIFVALLVTCACQELGLDDLPPPRQRRRRVLAVITGTWDVPPSMFGLGSSAHRMQYLERVLHGYVAACEAGFEVHVVLSTYKVPRPSLQLPDANVFFCDRLASALPIVIARFRRERLPTGTFGSMGTLAQKHRQVFAAKLKDGYNLFIAQEDDILVKPHTIMYFLKWAPHVKRTKWYPSFLLYELLVSFHGRDQLVSRPSAFLLEALTVFRLYRVEGHIWLRRPWPRQALYMLTASMLADLPEDWVDATPPGNTEFNAYYNYFWLQEHFNPGIPVEDLPASYVHHSPNNYASSWVEKDKSEGHHMFNTFQFEEINMACLGEKIPRHRFHNMFPKSDVTFAPAGPAPCKRCLDDGAFGVRLDVDKIPNIMPYKTAGLLEHIHVTVTCKQRHQVKWRPLN